MAALLNGFLSRPSSIWEPDILVCRASPAMRLQHCSAKSNDIKTVVKSTRFYPFKELEALNILFGVCSSQHKQCGSCLAISANIGYGKEQVTREPPFSMNAETVTCINIRESTIVGEMWRSDYTNFRFSASIACRLLPTGNRLKDNNGVATPITSSVIGREQAEIGQPFFSMAIPPGDKRCCRRYEIPCASAVTNRYRSCSLIKAHTVVSGRLIS